MDLNSCHIWLFCALVTSWLFTCLAQSTRYSDLADSRLLFVTQHPQHLWRPLTSRGNQPMVNLQAVYPRTSLDRYQRDQLSYLIPQVPHTELYLNPSVISPPIQESSQIGDPTYIKAPFLTAQLPQRSLETPSFLDPRNFRTPDMTLKEMRRTLADVESHTQVKKMGNPNDYTGSRVLILLLREQCARLAQSNDPDILQFCLQFDSRFRSFLF
ncbi:hypothetical protein PoB_002134400 [Plakobranchus ocellatus]|uniref:Uncharacterized protein n=1 Tax=Plakobranchus ocellatus TaxID=259542 RepID=A0AAV3ZLT4_9GAST|nr:hypothetical protein PoB_002134400 [Plakobranchus ocellatus]